MTSDQIDANVLEARRAYHQVDDAAKRLLDTSVFDADQIFDKVRFVDYYRYVDVGLDELYAYLDERVPWIRPTDTGRGTFWCTARVERTGSTAMEAILRPLVRREVPPQRSVPARP